MTTKLTLKYLKWYKQERKGNERQTFEESKGKDQDIG